MNKILKSAAIFLTAFLISTASMAEEKVFTKFLYIETAASSKLTYNSQKDNYHLSLCKPSRWVNYFSVAPKQYSGILSLDEFLVFFKKSDIKFKEGLNAGLVSVNKKTQKTERYVLAIKNMKLDKKRNCVAYDAEFLPESKPENLAKKYEFEYTALFIDSGDVCTNCNGF